MIPISRTIAAGLAALSLAFAAGGCNTDDAVKKDVNNAVDDVQDSDVGKDVGDAADDVGKGVGDAADDLTDGADDDGK